MIDQIIVRTALERMQEHAKGVHVEAWLSYRKREQMRVALRNIKYQRN